MPNNIEKRTEANETKHIDGYQTEVKDLKAFVHRYKVESIVNEVIIFIRPSDISKKDKLVDYICSGKLGSNNNSDLENMANYIIYGPYGLDLGNSIRNSTVVNQGAWKLKHIMDSYGKGKDMETILIEINKKENEMKPKQNVTSKKEDKGVLDWLAEGIKDVYNYGADKLSDLWGGIKSLVPTPVKDWVKTNLFSPERQKNTESINELYKKLKGPEKPDFLPFYLAMQGYNKQKDKLGNSKYLTVVDYSKPVSQNRLYVINMQTLTVENYVPTGHGKRSGNTQNTTNFSNTPNSNQTSIGFFRTPSGLQSNSKRSWKGLFLNGMEYSNDKASARGIAVHPVRSFFYSRTENGHRAGDSTSDGCITIRSVDNPSEIMDKIKGDSLIYSYYPDMAYLNRSTMIK